MAHGGGRPFAAQLALLSGVVGAALFLAAVVHGADYYLTPLEQRPLHADHELLRSSGRLGLLAGVGGLGLMVLNLGYLARKRLGASARIGSLRSWMSFHVVTGLLGPAAVLLHSTFYPTSILGTLALAALLVVVGTGLLGRYFYGRVPRSVHGRELELDEVRTRLRGLESELQSTGLRLRATSEPPDRDSMGVGFVRALRGVILGGRELRREYATLHVQLERDPRLAARAGEIRPLLQRCCREQQWLHRYHELRTLLGGWRFLHRWLAILMLLLAALHVVLAVEYGGLWILGGRGS